MSRVCSHCRVALTESTCICLFTLSCSISRIVLLDSRYTCVYKELLKTKYTYYVSITVREYTRITCGLHVMCK